MRVGKRKPRHQPLFALCHLLHQQLFLVPLYGVPCAVLAHVVIDLPVLQLDASTARVIHSDVTSLCPQKNAMSQANACRYRWPALVSAAPTLQIPALALPARAKPTPPQSTYLISKCKCLDSELRQNTQLQRLPLINIPHLHRMAFLSIWCAPASCRVGIRTVRPSTVRPTR